MQRMLKIAYERGLTQGVHSYHPDAEDLEVIKEAFDWRRAISAFKPTVDAARGVGRTVRSGSREVLRRASSSALGRQAALSGSGAGIGALASDEKNRGRGALIGALGGLGLGAGAHFGGLKSMNKTFKSLVQEGAKKSRGGQLSAKGIRKHVVNKMTSDPLKHETARQFLGAGVLGAGGAAGATALSKRLIPKEEPSFFSYGQAMGLTPEVYQAYPQQQPQYQKVGTDKTAILGELIHGAPAMAKMFARKKAIGQAKDEVREAIGVPTPEWRESGGLYDIPEVAARNLQQQIEEALASPKDVRPLETLSELPPKRKELEEMT